MDFNQLIPVIYLIGVFILVLPSFLHSNSKLKQFLANLSIWVIIVLIVTTISYFLFKWKNYSHGTTMAYTQDPNYKFWYAMWDKKVPRDLGSGFSIQNQKKINAKIYLIFVQVDHCIKSLIWFIYKQMLEN